MTADESPQENSVPNLPYGLRRRLMAVFAGIVLALALLNAFNLAWVGFYYRQLNTRLDRQARIHTLISRVRERREALFNFSRSRNRGYLTEQNPALSVAVSELTDDFTDVSADILYMLRDIARMTETLEEREAQLARDGAAGIGMIYLNDQGNDLVLLSDFVISELQILAETDMQGLSAFYEGFDARMSRTIVLSAALLAAMALLSLAIARQFVLSVSRPIHKLALQLVHFGEGDMETRVGAGLGGRDEIAVLGRSFDDMADRIRRLISSMRDKADLERRLSEQELARNEAERLLKEAELATLHAQINPHFLFNTLNILGSLSVVEGAPRTGKVIAELSELLRYSLRTGTATVRLADEVEAVRNYMGIQAVRFEGKIGWEEDIDGPLDDIRMPGMIFQPLVENAVKHGLEPIERQGRILLRIRRLETEVEIVLEDDGVGISDKALAVISNETVDTDSLGIRNVRRRLALHYGREILEISRDEAGGTVCRMVIPVA